MNGVAETRDVRHTERLRPVPVGDLRSVRKAERTAELLDAALRVIRREGATTSMGQIAVEAGITRPILYRHFGDVGGLYQAVADRFTGELFARAQSAVTVAPSGRDLIHSQVDHYLAYLEAEPNLYRFLTHQIPLERDDAREAIAGFVQQLAAAVADFLRGQGMPGTAADVTGRFFVGAIHTASDWWLTEPRISRADLAERLTDLLWDGIHAATTPPATAGPKRRR